jgi:hypothetical protein
VGERSFYDVTSEEDREALARLIKRGMFDYVIAIPEDLPEGDIIDLFKRAGLLQVSIDATGWPKQAVIKTERGIYVLRRVEEGVYRVGRQE